MLRKLLLILFFPALANAANPQTGCAELAANQAQPHITINAADRCTTNLLAGQLTINFASNANLTLSNAQWQYATLVLTDTGPVLSTGRDVIYPNVDTYTGGTSRSTFLFKNSTAQTLTIKRSGQTGVAVTAGSTSLLHHNGTDIEAVTASGGGAPTNATYITQTANGSLSAEQALSSLATGIVKNTTTTGVLSIAAQGTDYYAPAGTDVAFADGGTGLSAASDDQTLVSSGSAWVAKTLPDCTDTGGNHINYTQSTNAFSCGTSSGGGGGTPGGSTTQIQYNNAGAFGGDADHTWNAGTNVETIGSTAIPGVITGGAGAAGITGASLTVQGGTGGSSNAQGGDLILTGGAGGPASGQSGSVEISAISNAIRFRTNSNPRLEIDQQGAWLLNGNAGTSTYVLTTQGAGNTPVWGPIDLANVTQSSGTLGAVSGGTGQTTVTQGDLLYGSAANTWSKLAKSATATRYLANTGTSNNPAWAQVNVANGVTGVLPYANLTNGSALSVLGVTGNTGAAVASIAAGTDGFVLRRSGTALAFGTVPSTSIIPAIRTVTAAGAITGAATDRIICVNKTVGAASAVSLHGSPATGFEYVIKDCKGDALTNNITITPAAGNIDGAGTYVINTNYGAVTLVYSGAQWYVESDKL